MDFMAVVVIFILMGLSLILFARYRNRRNRIKREEEKKKFSQTADSKAEEFVLLGHFNPFHNEYPAPVDAIGILGGVALVSVMIARKEGGVPVIRQVGKDFLYQRHNAETTAGLAGFDYWNDFLFAFSEERVICPKISRQLEFYNDLLKDHKFCKDKSPMRLYLAMCLMAAELIIPELIATLKWQLARGYTEEFVTQWYGHKIYALFDKDTKELLPKDWRDLLKMPS
ncbi:MAG: hypothetical protein A2750_01120 [Candidatus Yanofskybacteria bacterium RIFCSPHIGHO2_01_FULL_45_42]|uniref:Uncharacterized protein n=3 Tax=Candidatus Yanofskyibacteriota TaxID=1752733 RepID=A0A1F8F4K7_9BACT|nr:MAG: hypothetical protein A2750_01120 [Candidatus Yanofskybacteria bacterium RIFCSPHIGHO2_01_FULL_45_42]OGN15511.1 MAG: hypothetical protein A3C81_01310 [Candidatus Yanofskybacteria bacterium RIFCSPHIGHO2_02_FULL_46_19]OGN27218.1 MAG: hypothetical protein A3B17_01220 [Candidatus Yanofskybacteria bacterium RIFCSPLOWO2_01_FULL_45_72]OGN31880.1 MAG: hypothetical protein A3J01_01855 [Candidatus Yanofskybacteria bacterium RIFCSPLOWO2_02_FULL_45_18]